LTFSIQHSAANITIHEPNLEGTMGKVHEQIDETLGKFIRAQQMFFVATGPLSASGHINLSPKGLDTLRILDPHTLVYLDYVGSGAETIAHLRENGRIVVMLCAFQGPPRIVRLHGRGEVLEPQNQQFKSVRGLFPAEPAGRAIVRISITRIADSCGFGVPRYSFEGHRPQLPGWASRKGAQGLLQYQADQNRSSIDGLPALQWPETNSATFDCD
jgi:pyridoxamine 5'-phosphate oxidase-like protein